MKIIKTTLKIIVVLVIILVVVVAIFMSTKAKENVQADAKIEQEIDYLDTKLIDIINNLNNIKLQDYKITVAKVQEEADTSKAGEKEEKSGESEKDETDTSKEEKDVTKVEKEVIVTSGGEIPWQIIKDEVEVLFSTWSSIVLDLYELGVPSETIVEFSNTLDKVIISVKEQNKEQTAIYLAKAYSFLPEFIKNSQIDQTKKKIIETKSHVIISYAYVQTQNWDKVQGEVINAEKKYAEILNDVSKKQDSRKYNINKGSILIQELKNSLSTKEAEIYYVKYKNLLEELNTF